MSSANDFVKSISDLHTSAGRITSGLESVVQAIDSIAKENAPYIKNPMPGKNGEAIQELLDTIRQQITEVVDHGRSFEDKLSDYSSEITDLTQQLEKTKKDSMLDPITGIGNRKRFEEALKTILESLSDFNNQVSVLLADVDDFKNVNDTLGHHIGDQVLRLVASDFKQNLKGGDVVARWGGDEFAAILPNTTLENAYSVADSVRKSIGSRKLKNTTSGEVVGQISMSIGVSTYRQGDNAHKLIFRADEALYEAKRQGRDRVVVEKEDD
ncbi:GGDEF domain-containing protein [Magnetovibrio sp. PR-2]|uniref:GGDEF domain-containing protein n=1 Tax=Magnetovibrio sp. PR-2 TaxID=3120356 RepID=UPI002FCE311E